MKNRYISILPIAIAGVLLLTGCATQTITESVLPMTESSTTENALKSGKVKDDEKRKNSDDDNEAYDEESKINDADVIEITLNAQSISATSDDVTISGTTITITEEGTYSFSGELSDGNIIVDTSKDEKVHIILNGVSINSETFAPIYVAQADKVSVTLKEGTTNTLTNGGSFIAIDDNNVDAVIYSKDDITFKGAGTLIITSPSGNGIVGKDDVTITDGTYEITASESAIRANDSVKIDDGSFTIVTDADGIHAEKSDDDSIGDIYIAEGNFDINAKDDGIHATTTLVIDGGTFKITAAEGLEATVVTINDGNISIEASDDGINAANKSSAYSPKVEINGGKINITMGPGDTDGVDANGDIIINGGTINVTGNSTFDFDGEGTINGGTVIANGEEVTTLPNQMMGGHGGMGGPNGEKMGPKDGMRDPNGEKMEPKDGMKGPNGGMMEPRDGMRGPSGGMGEPADRMRNENGDMRGTK